MRIPSGLLHPIVWVVSRLGWMLAAVFLFVIFAVTGLAALYFYLRGYLPPEGAMGLIALVAGLSCLVAGWWATARNPGVPLKINSDPANPLQQVAGLEKMVRQAVVKDPLGAALSALAIGVVVQSVPEVGQLLRRLLNDQAPRPERNQRNSDVPWPFQPP